jgi:hypothetical protein
MALAVWVLAMSLLCTGAEDPEVHFAGAHGTDTDDHGVADHRESARAGEGLTLSSAPSHLDCGEASAFVAACGIRIAVLPQEAGLVGHAHVTITAGGLLPPHRAESPPLEAVSITPLRI